jgi:site-specific recombinase XerD
MKLELPTTKVTYKLPDILSSKDVQAILLSTGNIKHKALLYLVYGCGLRVSEAVRLRLKDIDGERMTLHIRECKNRHDRYVILSPKVHKMLREYWRHCHFTDYVFPGAKPARPITTSTASLIYKKAKAQAGVTKQGGIHALRHAFATHMLEADEDLFTIQKLLGHSSIQTTVRYLRFVPDRNTKIKSPIEQLTI